jgi:hypothetical protein
MFEAAYHVVDKRVGQMRARGLTNTAVRDCLEGIVVAASEKLGEAGRGDK